jgi:hypothetical protein
MNLREQWAEWVDYSIQHFQWAVLQGDLSEKEFDNFLCEIKEKLKKPSIQDIKTFIEKKALKFNIPIDQPPKKFPDELVPYSGTFLQAIFGGVENRIEVEINKNLKPIKLSLYEERTLDGLINFVGLKNFPRDQRTGSDHFNWVYGTITKNQIYEMAGVKKTRQKDGVERFSGKERKKIDKALNSLAGAQYYIAYKDYKRGMVAWDDKAQLIHVRKFSNLERYDPKSERYQYCDVWLHDIVIANIDSFLRLLPPTKDIYPELKEYIKTHKNISLFRAYRFVKWLHKHGSKNVTPRINWLNLARDLGMTSAIEQKRWARISKNLTSLYKMGKALGYLESYQHKAHSKYTNDKTVDILRLKRERFKHLKVKNDDK